MENDLMAQASPWVALTLIAAPALMTNATSLMVMSTANRLGRTVDRVRALAREAEAAGSTAEGSHLLASLALAQRRAAITMRALTALYIAVAAFAAGTLAAFIGAIPGLTAYALISEGAVAVTFTFGGFAFAALFLASAMLVIETILGHRLLQQDIARSRATVFGLQRADAAATGAKHD